MEQMDPSEAETTSHHEDNHSEKTPKVRGTKTHLNAFDSSSKSVVDALAQKGERCEGIDGRLRHVEDFINDNLGEFRGSADLLSDTATLVISMEDRLKGYEVELKYVLVTLTNLQDTVTLLKQVVAQGGSCSTALVKIRIKEPDAYDGTRDAKLLGNFCWNVE